VALLTVALGVGATTAVFTVVNGVLLRPVSLPDAERAVFILERNLEQEINRISVSPANFWDWREQNQTFEEMSAIRRASFNLIGAGEPERLAGLLVSRGFFRVAGAPPVLGRGFLETEDRPGGDRVVVLSHGLWERRFAADPGVLGNTLNLNDEVYTVVGVASQEIGFPSGVDLWAPLAWDYPSYPRNDHYLGVMGRMKAGVTLAEARADLDRIATQLESAFPDTNQGWRARADPLLDILVGSMRPRLLLLLGAVGLVLLIAIANVSNLQLARATGRGSELALRQAVGAGRGQLMRQLLVESLMLGLLGGALGLVVVVWGTELLLELFARYIPRSDGVTIDARVFGFALLVSVTASVLFGILPALHASSSQLIGRLREGSGTTTSGAGGLRARSLLVGGEVALALVLLVAAGLLVRSFANLQSVDPGLSTDSTLVVSLDLPEAKYDEPAAREAFFGELLSRLHTLPGVVAAGTVAPLPLGGQWIGSEFLIEGQSQTADEAPVSNLRFTSPGYLEMMEIPLLAGRVLTASDGAQAQPVMVINRTLAQRHFPDGDAIGRRITFDLPLDEESRWHTVIGIVGDVRWAGLDEEAGAETYLSVLQSPHLEVNLLVRARTAPES